jgi:hypothetical protein
MSTALVATRSLRLSSQLREHTANTPRNPIGLAGVQLNRLLHAVPTVSHTFSHCNPNGVRSTSSGDRILGLLSLHHSILDRDPASCAVLAAENVRLRFLMTVD